MEIPLKKLDQRIKRSKRTGKVALSGVALLSLACGSLLLQGLLVARATGDSEVMARAVVGLVIVVSFDLFAVFLIRRQYRLLDEARRDLQELIGALPAEKSHAPPGA